MAESALSLVERLRAALDRAEEIARAAEDEVPHNATWRAERELVVAPIPGSEFVAVVAELFDPVRVGVGQHIALHDPAHVLRTVAAHRKILAYAERADQLEVAVDDAFRVGPRDEETNPYLGDLILAALASIYFPGERDEV